MTVVDDAQLVRDIAAFIITTRDKTGTRPAPECSSKKLDVSRHKIRLLTRWVESEVTARTTSPSVARPVARATQGRADLGVVARQARQSGPPCPAHPPPAHRPTSR